MGIYGDEWVERLIEGLRQQVKDLKAENERLKWEVEALKISKRGHNES